MGRLQEADVVLPGQGSKRKRLRSGEHQDDGRAYRIFKTHDLIISPAFIVVKAANEFKDKVRRIREQCGGLFSRQTPPISSGRPTSPT